MKSYEILKKSVQTHGAKHIASEMSLSTSLIYKWCESNERPEDTGADNPLDRIIHLYQITGDTGPIEWRCRQTNGIRIDNPKTLPHQKAPIIKTTQTILREFSDVLEAVSESYENENRIDLEEAKRIRKEWEELKMAAESFVVACEQGVYEHGDQKE